MKGFPHSCDWWERNVKPLLNHELWVGGCPDRTDADDTASDERRLEGDEV